MSLGGQGLASDASPAVITYGPDGTMYGSPAQARAAGVDNPTYQPPAPSGGMRDLPPDFIPLPGPDFPPMPRQAVGGATPALPPDFIPLPGPDFSPMPNLPSGGKGGADPYSQMGSGSDPYSKIMSQMPILQNPYGRSSGGAFGGYDPSLYNNAFMGSNSRLNLSGLIGGGGGGDSGSGGSGLPSGPIAPTTPEEFAAQSARNQKLNDFLTGVLPTIFSPFSTMARGLYDTPIAGGIANFFSPPGSMPNFSVPVENAGTYAGMPPMGQTSYESGVGNPAEGGSSPPGELGSTSVTADADNSGNTGGGGGAGGGTDYGSSGFGDYFKGGLVNSVGGSDPAGPDEGQINIMRGEYVIKKSAVKKYGAGLLGMINDGKIPAKKLKSLLG